MKNLAFFSSRKRKPEIQAPIRVERPLQPHQALQALTVDCFETLMSERVVDIAIIWQSQRGVKICLPRHRIVKRASCKGITQETS